jgi:N-acetylneuraminic acid mutarotase
MVQKRVMHTATVLRDGQVLVAGGSSVSGAAFASSEIYDPTTAVWSPAGDMKYARDRHTATLLDDGRVFVVGGTNPAGENSLFAELYDPDTGSWSLAEKMPTALTRPAAALLGDGRVLVVAGSTFVVYDPANDAWSSTDYVGSPRRSQVALLPDGRVLLAGGDREGARAWAKVFDPAGGTWSSMDAMADPRVGHTLTALTSGQILVAGGIGGSGFRSRDILASAEVYNPLTETWSSAGE